MEGKSQIVLYEKFILITTSKMDSDSTKTRGRQLSFIRVSIIILIRDGVCFVLFMDAAISFTGNLEQVYFGAPFTLIGFCPLATPI